MPVAFQPTNFNEFMLIFKIHCSLKNQTNKIMSFIFLSQIHKQNIFLVDEDPKWQYKARILFFSLLERTLLSLIVAVIRCHQIISE